MANTVAAVLERRSVVALDLLTVRLLSLFAGSAGAVLAVDPGFAVILVHDSAPDQPQNPDQPRQLKRPAGGRTPARSDARDYLTGALATARPRPGRTCRR